ncbi:unnamed protein product [Amoebophrya sp. A25]|nr:unnamed protein product [Amoebophrya sp. A25]|eukprot:GSA25T00005110001.1
MILRGPRQEGDAPFKTKRSPVSSSSSASSLLLLPSPSSSSREFNENTNHTSRKIIEQNKAGGLPRSASSSSSSSRCCQAHDALASVARTGNSSCRRVCGSDDASRAFSGAALVGSSQRWQSSKEGSAGAPVFVLSRHEKRAQNSGAAISARSEASRTQASSSRRARSVNETDQTTRRRATAFASSIIDRAPFTRPRSSTARREERHSGWHADSASTSLESWTPYSAVGPSEGPKNNGYGQCGNSSSSADEDSSCGTAGDAYSFPATSGARFSSRVERHRARTASSLAVSNEPSQEATIQQGETDGTSGTNEIGAARLSFGYDCRVRAAREDPVGSSETTKYVRLETNADSVQCPDGTCGCVQRPRAAPQNRVACAGQDHNRRKGTSRLWVFCYSVSSKTRTDHSTSSRPRRPGHDAVDGLDQKPNASQRDCSDNLPPNNERDVEMASRSEDSVCIRHYTCLPLRGQGHDTSSSSSVPPENDEGVAATRRNRPRSGEQSRALGPRRHHCREQDLTEDIACKRLREHCGRLVYALRIFFTLFRGMIFLIMAEPILSPTLVSAQPSIFFKREKRDLQPHICAPAGASILTAEECVYASRQLGMGDQGLILTQNTDDDGWPDGCYQALFPGDVNYRLVLHLTDATTAQRPLLASQFFALCKAKNDPVSLDSLYQGARGFFSGTLTVQKVRHPSLLLGTMAFLNAVREAIAYAAENGVKLKDVTLTEAESFHPRRDAKRSGTALLLNSQHTTSSSSSRGASRKEVHAISAGDGSQSLKNLNGKGQQLLPPPPGFPAFSPSGSPQHEIRTAGGISLIAAEEQVTEGLEQAPACVDGAIEPLPMVSMDYDITVNYRIALQNEVYLQGTPAGERWVNETRDKVAALLAQYGDAALTTRIKATNSQASALLFDPVSGPFADALGAVTNKANATVVLRSFSFEVTDMATFMSETIPPRAALKQLLGSVGGYGAFPANGKMALLFQPKLIGSTSTNFTGFNTVAAPNTGRGYVTCFYALALEVKAEAGKANYTYELGVAAQQMNTLLHVTERMLLRNGRVFTALGMRMRAQSVGVQADAMAQQLQAVFVLEKRRRQLGLDLKAVAALSKMLWKLRELSSADAAAKTPDTTTALDAYVSDLAAKLGGWWSDVENIKSLYNPSYRLNDELEKIAKKRETIEKQTMLANDEENKKVMLALSTAAYLGISAVPGLDKIKTCRFEPVEYPTTTTTTTPIRYVNALDVKIRAAPKGTTERITGSFVVVRTGSTFDAHALEAALAAHLGKKFAQYNYEWARLTSVPGMVRKLLFPDCDSLRGCSPQKPNKIRIQIGDGRTQAPTAPPAPKFISVNQGATRIFGRFLIKVTSFPLEILDRASTAARDFETQLIAALQSVFQARPGHLRIKEIGPVQYNQALPNGGVGYIDPTTGDFVLGNATDYTNGIGATWRVSPAAASQAQQMQFESMNSTAKATLVANMMGLNISNITQLSVGFTMTDPEFEKDPYYGLLYRADKYIGSLPLRTITDLLNANLKNFAGTVSKLDHRMLVRSQSGLGVVSNKGAGGVSALSTGVQWRDGFGSMSSGNVAISWSGGGGLAQMSLVDKTGFGQTPNPQVSSSPADASGLFKVNALFLLDFSQIPEVEKGEFGFVDWYFKSLFEVVVQKSLGVSNVKAKVRTAARTGKGSNFFFVLVELSSEANIRSDIIDIASVSYIRAALGNAQNECSICNQFLQSASGMGGLFAPGATPEDGDTFPPTGCDPSLSKWFLGSYADRDMTDPKWRAMVFDMCVNAQPAVAASPDQLSTVFNSGVTTGPMLTISAAAQARIAGDQVLKTVNSEGASRAVIAGAFGGFGASLVNSVSHVLASEAERGYFVDFTIRAPFDIADDVRKALADPVLPYVLTSPEGAEIRGVLVDGGDAAKMLDSPPATGGAGLHLRNFGSTSLTVPNAFADAESVLGGGVTVDINLPGNKDQTIDFQTVAARPAAIRASALRRGLTSQVPLAAASR